MLKPRQGEENLEWKVRSIESTKKVKQERRVEELKIILMEIIIQSMEFVLELIVTVLTILVKEEMPIVINLSLLLFQHLDLDTDMLRLFLHWITGQLLSLHLHLHRRLGLILV